MRSTKCIQSFDRWQLALNFANLEKNIFILTSWQNASKFITGRVFFQFKFIANWQFAAEIFKNKKISYPSARIWNPDLQLIRPEHYYHKTNLASEIEGCWILCPTKCVKSFPIWHFALNFCQIGKKVNVFNWTVMLYF